MKTPASLRPLRLQVRALWCTALALACAAAAAPNTLHVADDGTPDVALNLSGPRWTGTLDAARLPADPVAGRNVVPASVSADAWVEAGGYLATRSGNFAAGDFGIYLNGNQFADPYGNLTTPTVSVGTIYLSDGSQLSAGNGRLLWTDPSGNVLNVVTEP